MKKIFLLMLLSCILNCNIHSNMMITVSIDKNNPLYKAKAETYNDNELFDIAIKNLDKRFKALNIKARYTKKYIDQNKLIIDIYNTLKDTDIKLLIEINGKLDFKIVSDEGSNKLFEMKNKADNEKNVIFNDDYSLKDEYKELLPINTEVLRISREFNLSVDKIELIVVENKSLLGDKVNIIPESVKIKDDYSGHPVVLFQFDESDAKNWADFTEKAAINQRQIAIILDNIVLAYPRVMEKIPNGKCQLSFGQISIDKLKIFAVILKTSSLDVPLSIINISK